MGRLLRWWHLWYLLVAWHDLGAVHVAAIVASPPVDGGKADWKSGDLANPTVLVFAEHFCTKATFFERIPLGQPGQSFSDGWDWSSLTVLEVTKTFRWTIGTIALWHLPRKMTRFAYNLSFSNHIFCRCRFLPVDTKGVEWVHSPKRFMSTQKCVRIPRVFPGHPHVRCSRWVLFFTLHQANNS